MKRRRFGDYELVRRIGQDGPFYLFCARHEKLDRLVTLKILLDRQRSLDAELVFRRELEAADRLDHPAIVRVYETGVWNGKPYLAQAFVPGERLAERLMRGAVPPRLAWKWGQQLADALQHAHERQVYHGSLRPEVVWLSHEGDVRVSGFGNPVLFENLELDAALTWAGYLAPEQAGGRGAVGRATDVYGLGALLFAMVTGGPPFQGATLAETCRLIRNHSAIQPSRLHPGLSAEVDRVCLQCLRKEPSRRYGTDRPMARLLADLRSSEPGRISPESPWIRWLRRHFHWLRAAVLILLFGVIPAGFDQMRHRACWEVLLDPAAAPSLHERANLHFKQRWSDRPGSREFQAAVELGRTRLGQVEGAPVQWQRPANEWDAVANLARILGAASVGLNESARQALADAQSSGYQPRTEIEQKLWRECLAMVMGKSDP